MMDNINIYIDADDEIQHSIDNFSDFIMSETIATSISKRDNLEKFDINGHLTGIAVERK